MEKTGTTAIQKLLYEQALCLRDHAVYVPTTLGENHINFAVYAAKQHNMSDLLKRRRLSRSEQNMRNQIKNLRRYSWKEILCSHKRCVRSFCSL